MDEHLMPLIVVEPDLGRFEHLLDGAGAQVYTSRIPPSFRLSNRRRFRRRFRRKAFSGHKCTIGEEETWSLHRAVLFDFMTERYGREFLYECMSRSQDKRRKAFSGPKCTIGEAETWSLHRAVLFDFMTERYGREFLCECLSRSQDKRW
ncbi:hypothetical protein CEXT_743301 [Caerostris extrusa]|uniref:BTB domain-containing protein n=1 Tax=Caerostris extrusa TaxID=172846 RepID=A0AAV4VWK3_CAEEX|nr:hypothetical protein CEXT_743301 [Caerostris extrusa]